MSTQVPQFERESGAEAILRSRTDTLDRAQQRALEAIEAQIGPEFDQYAEVAQRAIPQPQEAQLQDSAWPSMEVSSWQAQRLARPSQDSIVEFPE